MGWFPLLNVDAGLVLDPQPALGMQGIGRCFLLFVGGADAHWLVVSLNGFAVQSTLVVLHCRVMMPTGMIWLMLILMWVAPDAGVHVALDSVLSYADLAGCGPGVLNCWTFHPGVWSLMMDGTPLWMLIMLIARMALDWLIDPLGRNPEAGALLPVFYDGCCCRPMYWVHHLEQGRLLAGLEFCSRKCGCIGFLLVVMLLFVGFHLLEMVGRQLWYSELMILPGEVPDDDFSSAGGLQPSSVLCRVALWMHTPSALPPLGCGCGVTASGFVLKWIVDLVSSCGNIMLQ
ncbi:hypothetical protein Nepgr_026617 [Nepenthes gracilis]|uniref:Uncharacterized protein n=1 Tax=Nepenthes gracilis TaxID=150966 RepID=A0AAD3T8Q3_NEPGR|nr:hypothetical protein Nepgr_026617 [Nepenthes gracilis]